VNKARDIEGLYFECLTHGMKPLASTIFKLFAFAPEFWNNDIIHPIHKLGDALDPSNCRLWNHYTPSIHEKWTQVFLVNTTLDTKKPPGENQFRMKVYISDV
jgi:hypothetical protein